MPNLENKSLFIYYRDQISIPDKPVCRHLLPKVRMTWYGLVVPPLVEADAAPLLQQRGQALQGLWHGHVHLITSQML
jgi:hypothetical protein